MRRIIELLDHGNKAQAEKLYRDLYKPDYDTYSIKQLMGDLQHEVYELLMEVLHNGSVEDIRLEAADVANFAHMIILICDKEIK